MTAISTWIQEKTWPSSEVMTLGIESYPWSQMAAAGRRRSRRFRGRSSLCGAGGRRSAQST